MSRWPVLIFIFAALAIAGCGSDSSSSSDATGTEAALTKPKVEGTSEAPPTEVETNELIEGSGDEVEDGDEVTVQYLGAEYKNGKEFDSSWRLGRPFALKVGSGRVVAGWEEGMVGMKVGERREIIIPPDLAFGPTRQRSLPGNSTVVYVVDLLAIK